MSPSSFQDSVGASARRLLKMEGNPCHPAELLGLPSDPDTWEPQAISKALLDRLARIDGHPQARTPEADELRVALHVAAAQLRDPAVRSQLDESTGPESPADHANSLGDPLHAPGADEVGRSAPPIGVMAPQSAGGSSRQTVQDDFRIAAEHVLASCGGWNAESKRRLGYLARSASVDAGGLQQALVAITQQHEQPTRADLSPAMPSASEHVEQNSSPQPAVATLSRSVTSHRPLDHRVENPRTRTWMTIGTVIMFGASLVIAAGLLTLIIQEMIAAESAIETRAVSGVPASSKTDTDAAASVDSEEQESVPDDSVAVPTLISTDGAGLVRYLQSLSADAFVSAPEESLTGFTGVYDQLADRWPDLDEDARTAAPVALRDAVLAASEADEDIGLRALDDLRRDLEPLDSGVRTMEPRRLRRAVFAYGTLGLLVDTPIPPRSERELRSRLNSIASGLGGGSPEAGSFMSRAATALRVLALSLAPRPAETDRDSLLTGWAAWLGMSELFDPVAAVNLKLDAIEHISLNGEDPGFHQPTRAVLASLVRETDWMEDPGRVVSRRMLEWFDDSAFPTAALSVITGELVDAALLPGLDASMKLSTSASAPERMALRDQYALRTSHPQIGEGRLFASEWAGFAEELLEQGIPTDHRGALDRAVRAAALNEAAGFWASSDEQAARQSMDRARIGLEELTAASGGPVAFSGRGPARADGEWAAKYLQARRNADDRMRLLYELENTGGPAGEADADVLAEAASYSTPMEIRRQAQAIVVTHADRAAVLKGLLEVLPRAAAQDNVSAMLEAASGRPLPDVDDQAWRTQARRALVARLLELLSDPDQRYMDVAEDALQQSIRARVDLLPSSGENTTPAGLDAIEQSMRSSDSGDAGSSSVAEEYGDRLLRAAQRYPQRTALFATLPEIESRRVWRRRLTTSDTGHFAAETTSVLELFAYILGSERPSDTDRVNRLVTEAAAARRSASSVYQQIAINEVGMLRMNLLRLGGDS